MRLFPLSPAHSSFPPRREQGPSVKSCWWRPLVAVACSIWSPMGPLHLCRPLGISSAVTDSRLCNLLQYKSLDWISFCPGASEEPGVLAPLHISIFTGLWKIYPVCIIIFSLPYLCMLLNATLHINYLAAIGWLSLSHFIYSISLALQYFKHFLMSKVWNKSTPGPHRESHVNKIPSQM